MVSVIGEHSVGIGVAPGDVHRGMGPESLVAGVVAGSLGQVDDEGETSCDEDETASVCENGPDSSRSVIGSLTTGPLSSSLGMVVASLISSTECSIPLHQPKVFRFSKFFPGG